MKALLEKFKDKRVLVVGDVMVDSYLWGDVDRISPEAPIPIVAVTERENRLGGAANVARNLKALGAEITLSALIGDDAEGEVFMQLLKKRGISGDGIVKSPHRPTTTKTRILSRNQQMFRYDNETVDYLDGPAESELIKKTLATYESVKPEVVIFQDYNKGVLSDKLIRELISVCSENKVPTVVDPKARHFFSYEGCTLFKPNLKEVKEGIHVDIDPNSLDSLNAASAALREKLSHELTLFTLSEHGIYVEQAGSGKLIPAHVRNVSDVSGAGDTVISVAGLCMAVGADPVKMAELANLAGGLVCEEVGVVPIDPDKLLQETKNVV